MKRICLPLLYVATVLVMLVACKGNEPTPLSEEEQKVKLLSREWKLSSATVDGRNVTDQFAGLEITIQETKSFSVKNAVPPIWISAGNFQVEKSGSNYLVKRSDGINMTIQTLTETTAVLSMNYVAPSGSRTTGISGAFTFTFLPK